MTKPFVVLCGQYRSGSTLLLRVFNEHDSVLLTGENSAAIEQLISFYKGIIGLEQEPDYQARSENRNWFPAWYNHFSQGEIRLRIRQLMSALCGGGSGAKIAGYKEIRHGTPDSMRLEDFVSGLSGIWEGNARFIFLTRDVEQMLHSIAKSAAVTSGGLAKYRKQLHFQRDSFEKTTDKFKDTCRMLSYEDVVSGNGLLSDAVEFTGVRFSRDAWNRAASIKIG